MKVLIMAGGTGGHVFPALAVAELLRADQHEVEWMGTAAGLEARVVPEHDIPLRTIDVRGLRGTGWRRLVVAPFAILRAILQAIAIVRRLQPAVVLGMGGFAAGPGGIAAWLLRRPLVIHEQNAAAGLTNRLLARFARRVLQAFPDALPGATLVGNPVRAAFSALPPPERRFADRDGPLRLLVVGGSQGARALNERVPQALALCGGHPFDVWHQGGRTVEVAQQAYAEAGLSARIDAFIDDMAAAYAWADVVVCRAGAMTVAELSAAGVGAILVPFPAAVDDHQTRNGQHLVDRDAAVLIQEAVLTPQRLAQTLRDIGHRDRLLRMAQAARAAAMPDSGHRIASACLEVARP
ncbi:MAG: undecaprenyldiphospho-muramoylpentapeptide beta-N-acetylglucosaminyltransferase [Algiphilus sp.]|uniref:undecaprenyldiphospho-muramoylpentapeptide beta-N-acetylglucosaminyltransferase n=1 Tax=Algiphilus sp. TaxID=1872431 RepID=UPI0032EE5C84|nr:undecaprenyldiphospho-muramoylpentapeptide beta-N-acetylglucosaminyltransferase [Algiphilus sp.]